MRDLTRWISLGAMLALTACGSGSETIVTAAYPDLPADRVLYDATFYTTEQGIRQVLNHADTMYVDEDSTTARMFGVKLVMYDTLGHVTANLTSDRGRYDQRTQKTVAQGHVVLVLADGRQIETEELNYDPESHRIWSNVFTRMRYPASQGGGSTTFDTFTVDDKFLNPSGTNARGRIPGLKL
jgi:LPS export ABC transporter protein LptC